MLFILTMRRHYITIFLLAFENTCIINLVAQDMLSKHIYACYTFIEIISSGVNHFSKVNVLVEVVVT